ncbi:hypothetical protein GCM10010448_68520 [Streptomyces glomeratus]|uniref:Uncharacterized protein n=1 Tax=Streptomyces glomeratus TaxID=284452 RepID=A0ABP6M4F3_9ACTN
MTPGTFGNRAKACFRNLPGRSVNGARPPHPTATAVPARWLRHPRPDHHPPTTAPRADSDKSEHDHQDRRTT